MGKTAIPYAEMGWPLTSGCTKISPGCDSCWACNQIASRLTHLPDYKGAAVMRNGRAEWTGKIMTLDRHLQEPVHWGKPRRIFVNPMSDLFHPDIPFDFIHEVWDIIKQCPQHQFMVLTKRVDRMAEVIEMIYRKEALGHAMGFWSHLWLGVTCENQEQADKKIPVLLKIPAKIRFVSVEPMLGSVNLRQINYDRMVEIDALTGDHGVVHPLQGRSENHFNWVIAGCESGPHRRHADINWFRSLRDQCQAAGVPYFLKQMEINGRVMEMPILDGKIYNKMPLTER